MKPSGGSCAITFFITMMNIITKFGNFEKILNVTVVHGPINLRLMRIEDVFIIN